MDFDPVRAKAALKQDDAGIVSPLARSRAETVPHPTGEWTVERARAYLDAMDPQIANLFPDRLVGSELGQIPDGWNVAGFSDVVTQLRENENPLASLETVYSHYSIPAYDDSQTPKRELGEGIKSVKTRVPSGTVLLSKLNPESNEYGFLTSPIMTGQFAQLSSWFFGPSLHLTARMPTASCALPPSGSVSNPLSQAPQRATNVPSRAILALEVLYPPAPILETFETAASAYLNQAVAIARDSKTLAGCATRSCRSCCRVRCGLETR